jgi:membrane fusion protein (multidrug efflux system)
MNMRILTAWLLLSLCNAALAGEQDGVSALVQTTALRQMNLYSRVSGYGTVVPELGATMNLNFPKAGRVTRLFVSPGQQVNRGADLLEITTDPAGTLAYSQAENAAVYARGELDRIKSLFERQLATRSQVESAHRALKDAEEALAAQSALGQGARQDKLKSPFNGTVISVALAPGDRFAAGANLAQLVHTDFLRVRLGIEPEESRQIARGMKVRLTSVFSTQDTVEGEVMQVAGQIDPQTQLVDIIVRFKGNNLLPGTKVKGDIATIGHEARVVPRQAVLRDAGGAYVFQVVNGKAHRTDVKTGLEDSGWIEVQNSLVPNAPVVTLGNYELQDNMAVRESTP